MTTATITEINELPTAYTADLNKFYRFGCPKKRDVILKQLKEKMISKRINFNQLFPNKTKRKDVMNHVLLGVSISGIYAIESSTLANNVGCSVRTVNEAVKNLKETGELIVTGLADGCNKYVFVLKSHENFQRIVEEVFYMDIAEPIAEQIAELESAENADVTALNDDISGVQSFKSLQSFSSKQEINNYIASAVEAELLSIQNDEAKEAETVATYYTNEFQHKFYNLFRNEWSISPEIRESMAILGLRLGSNCTTVQYRNAYQAVFKIDRFIKAGGIVREGIPALFTSIYQHGLKMDEYTQVYQQKNVMIPVEPVRKVKPVPFYNWLEIRE